MNLIMILVGLVLRLIGANQSFWLDEGASIEIALTPISGFVEKMATDFHPPLFYLLLKSWLPLAGNMEWLIRLPFILLGVATLPAFFFLLKDIFGEHKRSVPFIGMALLAFSPFHIYYSQELRMYSLNTLFTVLSWLCLLRFQRKANSKDLIIFTVLNTLNLYTFYGAFFNLAAQILYLLFAQKRIRALFFSILVSLLFFAPWLPVMLRQVEVGGYLKNALPGWQVLSGSLTAKSLLLIPLKFFFGRISFAPKSLYFLLAGITSALYLFPLVIVLIKKEKKSLPFFFWAIIPLFIASIISLKTPVLGYWRFLFVLPPLLALTSFGISNFSQSGKNFFFGSLIFFSLLSTLIYWYSPTNQREDWRGLSVYVDRPNSLTIVNFPFAFAPLRFYAPNLNYTPAQSSLGILRPDLIESVLSAPETSVFLLDYLSDLTDSQRKVKRDLEKAGFVLVSEKTFTNLGSIYEYRPPVKADPSSIRRIIK